MPTPTPISFSDVTAAQERLRPYLPVSPLRNYRLLDELVGHGIEVWVKHENHQPTQSFKIRNGLAALLSLPAAARELGVIAASTGNHGQALAYAGRMLGIRVAICVPRGNNPEKNAAIRALGAELIEVGATYDEAVAECEGIRSRRGMSLIHANNNRDVIAGAATLSLEMLSQQPALDAIVVAVGGGSQAVGALTVAEALKPELAVYAVAAAGAPAQYESWRRGEPLHGIPVHTFAEGIANGRACDLTFETLRAGLAGFLTVSDDEMYDAIRQLLRITHNLAEGAGAAGLAGLRNLAASLAGKQVGIVLSGGNLSQAALRRVMTCSAA